MKSRGMRFLVAIVVVGLLLAGCGGDEGEERESPSPSPTETATPTGTPTGTPAAQAAGQLKVTLSGDNEVPRADSNMDGSGTVTLNPEEGTACPSLNISTPADAQITGAHIHRGAEGANGPIVVRFESETKSVKSDCVNADANLIREISEQPSGFYVNVHTRQFPDGATRGQLSA